MTWCHACGWNVLAPERPAARTRVERLYEEIGKRLGDQLEGALIESEQLEPHTTFVRAAAFVIAAFVLALFASMLALAILLLTVAYRNPFADIGALLLLGTAYLMRPRLGKPPEEGRISRGEAPTLYGLADTVADALGTGRVDIIAIDHEFNASWSVVGLRRIRVLTLGLPLLTILRLSNELRYCARVRSRAQRRFAEVS